MAARIRSKLVIALAGTLFVTNPIAAQEDFDGRRVESLTFRGAQNLKPAELRASIVTEARRCKSILYAPFCLLLNSGTFEAKPRLNEEELARDQLRLRVLYWKRGYRQAQVQASVTPAGSGVAVAFDIDEGPPTIVESVDVTQSTPVLRPGQVQGVGLPAEGGALDVIALDSARIRLQSLLWDRGYADAQVRDTTLVSESGTAATLQVVIDPGARTTIDTVLVSGNEEVSTTTVLRLVDLRPGQTFRRRDLLEAQRRLYRSELFRQALIDVPPEADSTKLLEVRVREAPFRAVRLGAGFNTIEFVQTEARYTRYNWLGTARRLDMRAAVGNLFAHQLYGRSVFGSSVPQGIGSDVDDEYMRPTWQVSAEMTQPWLFSRRNAVSLGVFAHRRSVPGIVVDEGHGSSLTLTRRLDERISASLTYRFERTSVEAGDLYFCVNFGVCRQAMIEALRGTQNLSPLWLSAQADRADDPLAPSRGWMTRIDAEHASAATMSDFRYNRLTVEGARYMRMGSGVLAARVRAGWVRASATTAEAVGVAGASGTLLHPRKRLYAGGARSVRGYGENQLGPRILTIDPNLLLTPSDTTQQGCTTETIADGSCDPGFVPSDEFSPRPLGGNAVLEGTLEYRLPLTETLTGAVFVDAARVSDRDVTGVQGSRSAVTPGFGIRYRSPIGPVRVDLGVRPSLVEELPVVTQITDENGELTLVQLTTLKRYDPLESKGGFLGGLLNRLQLHLSIGEAF